MKLVAALALAPLLPEWALAEPLPQQINNTEASTPQNLP
jgi:hypothetical protein